MNYLLASFPIHGLVFLILCVLPTYASTFFSGNSKELWPYFKIKCGFRDCPYGYETDVEGSPICKCHDPCKYVYCMKGTKCVIHVPKTCNWQTCRPKAGCKDVGGKGRTKITLYTTPLSDDATASTHPSTPNSLCLLPLTEEAKDCKKMRKRWYFDPETGKCRKFRGCKTGGNNFGRKKRCKRKCIRKRRSPKRRGRGKNARRRAKE
ncbi:BPTI/Kunitz domain-containing protein 4-like [Haliotis rufescens]|uniref:BPTI/Kunitz domain-containing protein 4-like n=1 Tax=Haliotis rufescens TaxID=6454 RepID=UPI00201EBCF2|nr:BPTI/Kunitz domain-containing protein 4-like [Haliotis rufescens]